MVDVMQSALRAVTEGESIGADGMRSVMDCIMAGEATAAQIAGFLVGMRMKGETVEEITEAALVMRRLATPVPVTGDGPLIDTCGTGGDSAGTFNISTAAAFVVAAGGARVAKHGNRSVSSSSGSADVLEAAGARIDLVPAQVAACIDQVGIGFLFAPRHHGALRHAVAPRRELGIRTFFNLLGPLTNPAGARRQVLGLFSDRWLRPVAEVMRALGSEHVLVVHAADGLDELSTTGPTRVAELRHGEIREYVVEPEVFGLSRCGMKELQVGTAEESLAMIRSAFAGEPGPAAGIIALNAGAGLYVAGLVSDLKAGVDQAAGLLRSGDAGRRLEAFVQFTSAQVGP